MERLDVINSYLCQIWPAYTAVDVIGKGSFGQVYRLIRDGKHEAALKVIEVPTDQQEILNLYSEGADTETVYKQVYAQIESLQNEIELMESLKSASNIVNIEDYQVIKRSDVKLGWRVFIRMELLQSMGAYIREHGSLSEREVVKLGMDICSALIACQKINVIHRDIKPANIFRTAFGDYKLGDFGISRRMEETLASTRIGTPSFEAPEILLGREYDKTVDIYALGVVMYTYLNRGRKPFYPLPPEPITGNTREMSTRRRMKGDSFPDPVDASKELSEIIGIACAFNPSKRYQTAAEMYKALFEYALSRGYYPFNSNDSDEDQTTLIIHEPKRTHSKKVPFLIIAGSLVLLAVIGVTVWQPWKEKENEVGDSAKPAIELETLTNTPMPVHTNTPIPELTHTPTPTNTLTLIPTHTPTSKPTHTPTPKPTKTPTPKPTKTPSPKPTNTSTPIPTNTPDPAIYTDMVYGDQGEEVTLLQIQLIERGFLFGEADGIFGTDTEDAIKIVQEQAGLPITGEADPKTQEVLMTMQMDFVGQARKWGEAWSISTDYHTIALKRDGSVVIDTDRFEKVSDWRDIVAVSAGDVVLGIKQDGTVAVDVLKDDNSHSELVTTLNSWRDIVAVSQGAGILGLKRDGTVVACGNNDMGQCNVSDWRDIVAVSVGAEKHTVGLKRDGTVVAAGYNEGGKCDVGSWQDIVAVSAGTYCTLGLKQDGTVVAAGYKEFCDVDDWRDIVAISAGFKHSVGLRKDGTVVAVGDNEYGQCDVKDWTDIVAIATGSFHTIGLKQDGTVVAAGDRSLTDEEREIISGWTNIMTP